MVATVKRPEEWYQSERERVRRWRSKRSAAGRDIGRLPPVQDPIGKLSCARSLERYCLRYLPKTFCLRFSDDHCRVAEVMTDVVLNGGLFALAMPRGSGKTRLVEAAAMWAASYGYHGFTLLIGSTSGAAKEILDNIKTQFVTNPLLLADFPEICFPIRALEGITNRAAGQRYCGLPTYITWKSHEIVLPTIPDSPASGAIIRVAGLLGRIRGMSFTRSDGQVVRPTLTIPDDPQTDQSARNPLQCTKRENVITSTVLGLVGPGQTMSCVMPCTVIEQGDLADRMLDRNRNPQWRGIITKTLYSFPNDEAMKHWNKYYELVIEGLKRDQGPGASTRYYKKHRKAMDAGAKVAWPERYEKGELSGLQRAMNLYFANRSMFAAEYQNEPLNRNAACQVRVLTAAETAEKLNGVPRGTVPAEASGLYSFIDVQQKVLFWAVAGWSQTFGGGLVDYGTWPDQRRDYFTKNDLKVTFADALPHITGLEAQIYAALEACTAQLLEREFPRQGGAMMRISREIIDAGYNTDTVYKLCRQSRYAGLLLPSHGIGIGASKTPISQWKIQTGERRGTEWVIRRAANERGVRHVTFDTNFWKSFFHARLATAMGDPTCFALCGDDPSNHRLVADHLAAESPNRVEAKGRKVDEWSQRPERPDNDLLDCLVGTAVAASTDGCQLQLSTTSRPQEPRRQPLQVTF